MMNSGDVSVELHDRSKFQQKWIATHRSRPYLSLILLAKLQLLWFVAGEGQTFVRLDNRTARKATGVDCRVGRLIGTFPSNRLQFSETALDREQFWVLSIVQESFSNLLRELLNLGHLEANHGKIAGWGSGIRRRFKEFSRRGGEE